jgi:predicted glycoside hydrolase/deacetylase ChbG (UPF0249 family)
MKRLIVCADDYGFTPGVSRSICELLAAKRISATSVMAGSPYWPDEAEALRRAAGGADIGLHLTLTDQVPLGPMPKLAPSDRFPGKGTLIQAAWRGRLPLDEIRAEATRQYDRFEEHWGKPPAHIDGHHHTHHLPGIRDIVLDLAQRAGPHAWVRTCAATPSAIWARGVAPTKAAIIVGTGLGFPAAVHRRGIRSNADFAGAYVFDPDVPTSTLFEAFLRSAADNHLVMCHPGHSDATLSALDTMTAARDAEHAHFMSDAWPKLIATEGFELGPLRRS